MMEGFAEAVGIVAIVGVEGVGEGVALGLEHQAYAVVLVQGLIDGCGGGVGWDKQEAERWLFRLFEGFLVLGGVIFIELGLVLLAFGFVELTQFVVDGVDEVSAKGETTFAGGCSGGDECEEVRVDYTFVVDAGDLGETGGEGGQRA